MKKFITWLKEFFVHRQLSWLLREELELKCAFLVFCSSDVREDGSFAGPYGNARTFLAVYEQLKKANTAALANLYAAYPHLAGKGTPAGDCEQLRLVERIYALEYRI